MATVKINQISINELRSAITFSAEQTSQAADLVAKAVNGISGMSFSAKYGLESDLTNLKTKLNNQAQLSRACCRAVQETVDALVQVDDSAGTSSEAAWTGAASLTNSLVRTAVGLPLAVKVMLERLADINDTFTSVTTTPDTTTSGNSSGYQSQLPDWALENIDSPDPDWYYMKYKNAAGNQEFIGKIRKYNDPDKNGVIAVSCTYYTLRKLRDKGLGFPFQQNNTSGGNWNGWQWYVNSISVEKAAGSTSIQQLLDSFGGANKSVENVVVSFDGNHVLLLDKVFIDSNGITQVSYSDNTNWMEGGVLTDPTKTTPLVQESLNDFIKRYTVDNSIFGNIIGSVLIGRGET